MAGNKHTDVLGDCLVLGMGTTGVGVCHYLASLPTANVSSITLVGGATSKEGPEAEDLRTRGIDVRTATETIDKNFDTCIASPGISELSNFFMDAKAHSQEIMSEPELAWRMSPDKWIAITGTNGKTTVTSLITHLLLQANIAAVAVGNIGVSVCEQTRTRDEATWFVAELSSFQLASTKFLHPKVACLTNITPDHLDWHGSFEAYAEAKEKIFANVDEHDLAVLSVEDERLKAIAKHLEARGVRVCHVDVHSEPATAYAAFIRGSKLIVRRNGEEQEILAAHELAIAGDHNIQNALIAVSAAAELGIDAKSLAKGLRSFKPLEHRIEPVATIDGVHYVNDSKATNTNSTLAALTAFKAGELVLLLGGHDKGTPLDELARAVANHVAHTVCFGEAGPRIGKALEAQGAHESVIYAEHMQDALVAAKSVAHAGQTVLLSPACSSFDEFKNFEERGRVFKELVRKLDTHKEQA